ncbi:MAG TPA: hypothetical protein VLQ93_05820, partial [Myxococcaceae bacterium]|nr:hypothetical protein [Myxococcaceae bacterium]
MSDKLLEELGRVARERQHAERLDPRWESLAEGELSDAEREELERLAREEPAAAEAYEAFRPLEAEIRERIVARVEQELASATAGSPSAQVVPLVRPRRTRVLLPMLSALAAAVALFVVASPGDVPPVPAYALSLSGEQTVRSEVPGPEVARLGPGSRLELILRPEREVEGAVEVRAFLLRPGEARRWTPPMEHSPEGAVRIHGPVEELLPIPPGEWTLALAVGRPGTLPEEPEAIVPLVEGR